MGAALGAYGAAHLWPGEVSDPPRPDTLLRHDPRGESSRSTGPGGLVKDPLGELGLTTLSDGNDPLPPPDGVSRRFAMRLTDGAEVFRYVGPMMIESAAKHYRTQLSRSKYRIVRDAPMRTGGAILVGEKPGGTIEVTLRSRPRKSKIVQVSVIVRQRTPVGPSR